MIKRRKIKLTSLVKHNINLKVYVINVINIKINITNCRKMLKTAKDGGTKGKMIQPSDKFRPRGKRRNGKAEHLHRLKGKKSNKINLYKI